MNHKQLRAEIKRILGFLDEGNHSVFKKMYNSHTDVNRDINLIVDEMPRNELKWALTQCNNSYHRIFRILSE